MIEDNSMIGCEIQKYILHKILHKVSASKSLTSHRNMFTFSLYLIPNSKTERKLVEI